MAKWQELPQDILQLITHRLAIDDFLALRGVCTSWRSAAVIKMYSAKSKAPLLMNFTSNKSAIRSPSRVKTCNVGLCVLRSPIFSSPGWRLVSEWFSNYHILNPISGVRIKLPTMEKMHGWLTKIDRIAFSSSPSSSRNFTVMVSISWNSKPLGFALHRSGEDGWTAVSPSTDLPQPKVRGLAHYDGLFVALDDQHQISTLDEKQHQMRFRLVLGQNLEGRAYLVECSGSLLVAWKIGGQGDGTEYSFRVFKVDLEKGTEEEVKSLGNASLFLNYKSFFSVEFKADTCLAEIKPNCIYFPQYTNQEIYVYSMEHGKVERYTNRQGNHYFPPQWFQPEF